MTRKTLLTAAALAALLAASHAQAGTINFEAQTGQTTSNLSIATNGVTVKFTSPGRYTVGSTAGLYTLLTGNALINLGFDPAALVIKFSIPVSAFSLDFGLTDLLGLGGSDVLTTSVGQFTATVPSSTLFPEGVLNYAGAAVSSVTLNSAYTIAIDNVSVPEPATMAILGIGVAGLVGTRRRRV